MSEDPIVIVSAARTPLGAFRGCLAEITAVDLGAVAMRAAVQRARLPATRIDEVLMGCVLQAGLGQAPARQAALRAGIPPSAGCTTVHKVCGSGMKAAMQGADALRAGSCEVVVAGGMESMSQAPYLLARARSGYRLGHGELLDHLLLDGLEDSYGAQTRGRLMGSFAEDCAAAYGFGREAQDAFAMRSTLRAQAAWQEGAFAWEVAPVPIPAHRRGHERGAPADIAIDEGPPSLRAERIPDLAPAFRDGGTVTAGNASSIADGAAAMVLMRMATARELGLTPLARLLAHASHAAEPAGFPTAPVGAVRRLLGRAGWRVADVDLWEINEAFAVVAMAAMHELGLDADRVNVHGGACVLGHPIGASGARIVVTLLGALRRRGLSRGIATLCIGGGEATAVAVEML